MSFTSWWSWVRNDSILKISHKAQEKPEDENIVALREENGSLMRRLESSDQERSVNQEKIRRLESEVRASHSANEILKRQADEADARLSNDSTVIQELERELKKSYRLECDAKQNNERHLLKIRQLEKRTEEYGREKEALQHDVKQLNDRHLLDSEKIRRQLELLSQAKKQAEETEIAHREKSNELYNQISSLQVGQAQLNDEQIIRRMQKLGRHLNSWVRTNFKNAQADKSLSDPPCKSLQLRAWIQGSVTELIQGYIFVPYHVGMPNDCGGEFIEVLKSNIENSLPERALRTWQAITCDFLEVSTKDNREMLVRDVIDRVEKRFGEYSTTDERSRQHQFEALLLGCFDLKTVLSRQQARYVFRCSPIRADFSLDFMAFGGGDGGSGDKVRLSLWPGLVKQSQGFPESLLEPELVWTMDGYSSDIS